MRIVEVLPSFEVGGAERLVSLLSMELAKLGHAVAVVSLYNPVESWILRELRASGIEVLFCAKRAGLDVRVVPRLARIFARLQPDIVHTHLHTLKYVVPARLAFRHTAVAHTLHNLAQHEIEASGQAFQRAAFRLGVAPVAIGDAIARSVSEVYGLPAKATIPNGIPVAAFQTPSGTRQRVRAVLAIPEDVPVFVAVGRLNPQKDHATLLAAFADPNISSLNAHLILAGAGDLRSALIGQAEALGISSRVHLLGVRDDISALYAASDVFVLSSRYEGNPLVVMEAMASGLPIVATSVGSVPELVPANVGRLVSPGNPESLAAAMRQLAGDLPLARSLGIYAAQYAVEHFDVAVMARGYATLFDTIRKPQRQSGSTA